MCGWMEAVGEQQNTKKHVHPDDVRAGQRSGEGGRGGGRGGGWERKGCGEGGRGGGRGKEHINRKKKCMACKIDHDYGHICTHLLSFPSLPPSLLPVERICRSLECISLSSTSQQSSSGKAVTSSRPDLARIIFHCISPCLCLCVS